MVVTLLEVTRNASRLRGNLLWWMQTCCLSINPLRSCKKFFKQVFYVVKIYLHTVATTKWGGRSREIHLVCKKQCLGKRSTATTLRFAIYSDKIFTKSLFRLVINKQFSNWTYFISGPILFQNSSSSSEWKQSRDFNNKSFQFVGSKWLWTENIRFFVGFVALQILWDKDGLLWMRIGWNN